jgi:hypothetical protein
MRRALLCPQRHDRAEELSAVGWIDLNGDEGCPGYRTRGLRNHYVNLPQPFDLQGSGPSEHIVWVPQGEKNKRNAGREWTRINAIK